jgi:hypothetical protein
VRAEVGCHPLGALQHRVQIVQQPGRPLAMDASRNGLPDPIGFQPLLRAQTQVTLEPRFGFVAIPNGLLPVVLAAHLHGDRPFGHPAGERVVAAEQFAGQFDQVVVQLVLFGQPQQRFGRAGRLLLAVWANVAADRQVVLFPKVGKDAGELLHRAFHGRRSTRPSRLPAARRCPYSRPSRAARPPARRPANALPGGEPDLRARRDASWTLRPSLTKAANCGPAPSGVSRRTP